jgi:hypothetical protein
MTAEQLRSWLLQAPKPDALRVTCADEQIHDLQVAKNVSWRQLAETVAALRPELIEALGEKGVILRAVRPSEQPDDSASSSKARAAAPMPTGPQDPETARFFVVANIVAEAYRHATDVAFERLVSLFEAVNRRSEALEHSLESTHKMLKRALEDQVEAERDAAAAQASADADPLNAVVGAFAQSVAAGQAAKEAVGKVAAAVKKPNGANGAPNGKG